ncbi:uncharacterized protein LOC132712992 [Ruditapes philippinarum]|uniref:uncharacterized protein LOC132712992 n=1 Tax=Ruditapes philippinarum TaxID=129788 RepID=UPI00295AFCC3|nr:uncharacterized protein LOC132712992 [Ruditapes philippinarum]
MDDKVSKIDSRVDSLEFALGQAQSELDQMHQTEAQVKDDLLYVKSQSMRNNLIFGNIPEPKQETWENREQTLRRFFVDHLNIAQQLADNLQFERVHRMGDYNQRSGSPRKIVAKFAFYKDREMVRRLRRTKLNDTQFYLHEQFPPEIVARRKSLLPKLKNAKKQARQAWLAYDTLFIDGVPVSDKESDRSQMQNGNRK